MPHKPNLLSWDQDVATSPREFHETDNNRTNFAVYDICRLQTADCRLQTADCRLQTGGKMQTEGKVKKKNTRIKSGSNTRTRTFFSKTHTKMRFLALVKHYINLEFLNSPFCSHKGPNES